MKVDPRKGALPDQLPLLAQGIVRFEPKVNDIGTVALNSALRDSKSSGVARPSTGRKNRTDISQGPNKTPKWA